MTDSPAPPPSPKEKPAKPTEHSQDGIKSTEHAAETHTHRVAGRSGQTGG